MPKLSQSHWEHDDIIISWNNWFKRYRK